MSEQRRDALERFERAAELPLLILAIAMVPLLVLPLLVDLPTAVDAAFVALDWFIWAAFALDYLIRLGLNDRRWRYVRREWPNLLIVVLPFLRPLRVVRSARALRVLRLSRLTAVVSEVGQEAKRLLVRHHLHYVVLVVIVVGIGSASLMTILEESGGGPIHGFADSLWWAMTTLTTVGYGDTFPVTPAGRGLAAFLMLVGIALFGVLTANVAAFFLERSPHKSEDAVTAKLDEILRRLDALESSPGRE